MAINRLTKILSIENNYGIDRFGSTFIFIGVLVQIITYEVSGGNWLSLLSGCLGVISVVLCSQRKVGFYVFGFAQLITYVILCINQRLYGEIAENAFYFVTMLFGLVWWVRHYNDKEKAVETRKMTPKHILLLSAVTGLVIIGFAQVLAKTDDTQPYLDSMTTVPAIVAQILMITRYRESWYFWLTIDTGSIAMWAIAGDWCMVAQFVFWSVNCAYGMIKWENNNDKIQR